MEPSLASRGDRGGPSTGVFSNRIEREQLVPGDHIYSWRSACIYAHHGIYVGDGMVIHYTGAAGQEIGTGTFVNRIFSISSSPWRNSTPVCERCGVDQSRQNGVTKSCLDCFLAGFNLCLFRYSVTPAFFITQARGGTCTLAVSDPPEVVLHRARYLLGNNGFGTYSLFNNNCEDFAMYCKTGLLVDASSGAATRSGQISSLAAAMTLVASSPLGFLATGGGGLVVAGAMYSISRYLSDISIRWDVIKIPVETLVSRLPMSNPGAAS
ncbi:protein LEAD-SENSITIVE 1-like [Musa acuminata AAA Group]|uniref:protein LEAD-SENSITIVE 1-like n=1 Tax=Musa acuminata AAA Group TaxID=214697 RepID=UPI0031DCC649